MGIQGPRPWGPKCTLLKSFFHKMKKKSCLLSDKLPKTMFPPVLYFIMMVLLLYTTPKNTTTTNKQTKKLDQKIMKSKFPSYYKLQPFCYKSFEKKVFLHYIETKSKRNVFVLTEVPKDNYYCKKTIQKRKNLAKNFLMKYTQK